MFITFIKFIILRLKNVHGKMLIIGNTNESKAKNFYAQIKNIFNEIHLNSS